MSPKKKAKPKVRTQKPKPGFASNCEHYPKCPWGYKSGPSTITEPADEEEGMPATIQLGKLVRVRGTCKDTCREAPISHSVIAIIGGRVVDIGS